jgi:lipopolysaccharide transport system ATP-binding protein
VSDIIIKLENISKHYRLGQLGIRVAERSRSQTLRGDLQRRRLSWVEAWWHTLRGKEDPTLKIGQTNQLNAASRASAAGTGNSEPGTPNSLLKSQISHLNTNYIWALKDINLEVKQSEILGIISKNGAGKSKH